MYHHLSSFIIIYHHLYHVCGWNHVESKCLLIKSPIFLILPRGIPSLGGFIPHFRGSFPVFGRELRWSGCSALRADAHLRPGAPGGRDFSSKMRSWVAKKAGDQQNSQVLGICITLLCVIHVCLSIWFHMCVYIYIYIHTYIHTHIHQEEESFFSFGVLKLSSCSAVDQLSSFRVACVADRISSRNKLKFFKSKPTDPRSAMSFMCNLSGV